RALAGRRRLGLVPQVERGIAREHLHLGDAGATERVELLERQLVADPAERLTLLVLGIGDFAREQGAQDLALLGAALELARDVDLLRGVKQRQDVGVRAVPEGPSSAVAGNFFFLSMWTKITSWMSIVNSTHEPRNGMMRAENRRCPLGWMLSSNTTPGERCSCDTITRSAPLMTNVPRGVRIGSSPR